MRSWNKYYRIAFFGAIANLLVQVMVSLFFDPYLAAVFTPFYPVWFILLVVGWRRQHPRR